MIKKICTKCGKSKSLTEYYRVSYVENKYRPACKKCAMERQKKDYEKNRDKCLAYAKQWKIDNKERYRMIRQRFLERNPNYHNEYNAWYRKKQKAVKKGLKREMKWVWKSGRAKGTKTATAIA